MNDLHRRIIHRLAAAWLAISLALGGAVALYLVQTVDDQVVALATGEAEKLAADGRALLKQPQANLGALEQLAGEIVRQHFIVAEISDGEGRRLVRRQNPAHGALATRLAETQPLVGAERVRHKRLKIDGQTVLQVQVPLSDRDGKPLGWFSGLFLIDADIERQLRREMAVTLAIVLVAVLLTTVALYPVILALNRDVLRFSRELLKGNIELMEVLGSAIAKRDSDTNVHNYRVTIYAVRLGEAVGIDVAAMRHLIAGAFLHDVGKIGISDAILLKPARLDEDEFSTMKQHVALGVDIIGKSTWLAQAREVVEYHHEKWNGQGYLKGLQGEEIPLAARIFAIVDVFDALTSRRPYKAAMPFHEAMAIVKGYAGSHFDPRLVQAFEGIVGPLHDQIGRASEGDIEKLLWQLIEHYFFAAVSGRPIGRT